MSNVMTRILVSATSYSPFFTLVITYRKYDMGRY